MEFKRKKGAEHGCAWISAYDGMIVRFDGEQGAWTATLGEQRAHASTLKSAYERVVKQHLEMMAEFAAERAAYQTEQAAKAEAEAQAAAEADAAQAATVARFSERQRLLARIGPNAVARAYTEPGRALTRACPRLHVIGVLMVLVGLVLAIPHMALAALYERNRRPLNRARAWTRVHGREIAGRAALATGVAVLASIVALGALATYAIDSYTSLVSEREA